MEYQVITTKIYHNNDNNDIITKIDSRAQDHNKNVKLFLEDMHELKKLTLS